MSFFLSRDPVTGASAVVLCTKASSGDLLYIGPQYNRSWDLSCFSRPLYKNTEAFYNNIGFYARTFAGRVARLQALFAKVARGADRYDRLDEREIAADLVPWLMEVEGTGRANG